MDDGDRQGDMQFEKTTRVVIFQDETDGTWSVIKQTLPPTVIARGLAYSIARQVQYQTVNPRPGSDS